MKKNLKLEDLDCASCASKLEKAVKNIKGVNDARVNFMTQKMTVEAEDDEFDTIFKQIIKEAKKVDRAISISMS